ncbi:hypothetical protein SAMN06295967_12027 [Belliella buryatensis]|uniref:Uncharacterized protein n=1 Tax=Belliella buryatensis TaxID=1500549 RepID=A0A239GY17_9BACT|nr:hypothetical protein [Belliella buryatensis]SNS73811.1 hypothetical protein SAMN06295967_12027 [Belliella buryatensis]
MAGGTSGFTMIQSSKDNRSIRSGRTKMSESPYLLKHVKTLNSDPELYTELISERFDRKAQSNQFSILIFIILGILISTFFYFLIVG